jgi:branched-chain amino acid transport system substrate-binding protein
MEIAKSTDPKAISKAIMSHPKFDSMRGPGVWRADHQPLFKYGSFVVVGKGPKERKDKWDLVNVIGAYTGEDYLPPLKELGY